MRLKTLRLIFIWTFGSLALIVLLLFAAQRILGPEVKKLFVAEINKSLTAEVQIDDIELSLIKDFPFASMRFDGVRMKEALRKPSPNYLLKAGCISLRFNIWDLLSKKYSVKNIRLNDVEIAPHILTDSSDNYHIWKQSTSSTNGNFSFELQRIVIHRLHVKYNDEVSSTFVDANVPEFVAKGNFNNDAYVLDLSGNILLHNYSSRGIAYISERELMFALSLNADSRTGTYAIEKGKIETGKLSLTATGSLTYSEQQKHLNIDVSATGSTLEEMISLVPSRFLKSIEGYKFKGKGDIRSHIEGSFAGNCTPSISLRLDLQNGEIVERKSSVKLRNVSALAVYAVKQNGTRPSLSINNLQAGMGEGFISGSLSMQGFSPALLQCNLKASINLAELRQFIKSEYFTSMNGSLKLNAVFDGHITDMAHPTTNDFLNSNFTGSGSISKVNLAMKDYKLPIRNLESQFSFNGNDFQLQQCTFVAGKSDFDLRGNLINLLSWIFIKNESLSINGSLSSKRFDWDELSSAQQGSSGKYQFILPSDISINHLQIRTGQLSFGKFNASNITGTAQLRDKVLSVNNVAMQTCQGRLSGQANINGQSATHALLQAKLKLESVNVKTLFREFNNFGQDDLQDENLEGQISADVIFACTMKNNFDFDMNSIKTHADIMIENGRLVHFSPMLNLSSFLKVEDLADIRFETLHNQIDIANEVIYIPSMEIKSSALNLLLMGTHTFENGLDYHFTIALADLMAAKFKLRNRGYDNQSEFGLVEDDGRGRTKVYVSLTGTVDKPIVKYDRKAMREKISNDLKSQKVELKQAFKKELNWIQGDTVKRAQQLKEKEIQKKQEQGKFVIEWDDDKK